MLRPFKVTSGTSTLAVLTLAVFVVFVAQLSQAYKLGNKNSVLPPKIDDYNDDLLEEDKQISHSKKSGYGGGSGGDSVKLDNDFGLDEFKNLPSHGKKSSYGGPGELDYASKEDDYSDDGDSKPEIAKEEPAYGAPKSGGYGHGHGGKKVVKTEEIIKEETGYGDGPELKPEDVLDESAYSGGGNSGGYGGGKKIVETKEIIKEKSGYGHGGAKVIKTEEIIKEESGYGHGKPGGYGHGGAKVVKTEEIIKEESGYGHGKPGGYGHGGAKVVKTEEIIKEEPAYNAPKYGGYGYGGGKKVVKTEEIIKEESSYGHSKTGGYGHGKSVGYGGGPKVIKTEEIIKKDHIYDTPVIKTDDLVDESAYSGGGNRGGYGGGKKIVETKIIKEESGYGHSKKTGGYGYGKPRGYGHGGAKVVKTEEIIREESGYDGPELKPDDIIDESAYVGGGKGSGYGGGKKVVETKIIKEESGGYGGKSGGYGGGGGEVAKTTVVEDSAFVRGKSSYGVPKVPEYGVEDKEESGDEGGSYGGGVDTKVEEDYENVQEEKHINILKPNQCNKMVDGWLGSLQPLFHKRMDHYKMPNPSPIRLGSWAKISMYDGKLDNFGPICRQGDFRMYDQGEELIMDGIISVPEPSVKYCSDAYLYNRIKIRNRYVRLAAKEATFKVKVHIHKSSKKVEIDELEPVALNGFHLEDAHSKSGELVWPFSKVSQRDMLRPKLQFMGTLKNELCDQFRTMLYQPEFQRSIIEQV